MKLSAYAVRDGAIGAFLPPFFARSKGEAIRSFGEAANDEKHQFWRHASDYCLFHIGEFDDNAGMLIPVPDPERICSALEMKEPDPFVEEARVKSNGRAAL